MENKEQVLAEVKDLLNQVMVKLKGVSTLEINRDDDSYEGRYIDPLYPNDYIEDDDKKVPEPDKTLIYLQGIKGLTQRALSGVESVVHNEMQYYNSNC